MLNTSDQVQGQVTIDYGALIRVATGDFDGDGYDEFVVAWEGAGKSLNLRTYDTVSCWTAITAKGKIADEVLGDYKFLDVATGDFDDDGYDDIAVAFENGSSQLVVKVYSYDRVTGNLVAHAKVVEAIQPGQIAITAGDFNGDAIDDIAVAFSTRGNSNLYLYQVTGNLSTLTKKATAAPASGLGYDAWFELAYRVLGVGAGDFNADGIDELALAYGAPGKWYCNVAVYAADTAFVLTPKATLLSTWLTAYGELSLAVGDLNRDSIAEIFAGSVNGAQLSDMTAEIGIFQVAPDLNTISQKGYKVEDEQLNFDTGHLAVAAGAYDGKSVRVGPPTYRRMAQTQQVLAVINEPPKHGDEIDGTVITGRREPALGSMTYG